jgi:hypothetical protein
MLNEPDPYASLSLRDRLQMLAFEAQLAQLPPSLVSALWEVIPSTLPISSPGAPLLPLCLIGEAVGLALWWCPVLRCAHGSRLETLRLVH